MDTPRRNAADIDMRQFEGVFFEEAAEHLAAMESLLVRIDVAAPASDDLDAIFRAAHSIKGGSAMFGFTDMTSLTHELESLLDKVRKRERALSAGMVDVLLQSSDLLREQLAHYSGQGAAPRTPVDAMCTRLRVWLADDAPMAGVAAPASRASPTERTLAITLPAGAIADDVLNELLAQLGELGSLREIDAAAAGKRRKRKGAHAHRTFHLTTDADTDIVVTLFEFVMDSSQVRIECIESPPSAYGLFEPVAPACATPAPLDDASPGPRRDPGSESSIRVSVEKVDQLINQVGELVITQAMLCQAVGALDPVVHEQLLAGMADLERNTRDLQESVMSIRMLPIAFVFNRFPRLVRDLAHKLGKQVQLVTQGEGTELDKGLIEKISDPLTHLVRNSIDHGIELPEARIAAGKPALGTVTLRAAHQGGNILIEVCDDGGGLSRQQILAKARERGLPVSDAMSDGEVWSVVFDAGFSTAQVVTDVSGRGVGMDVVRRNIRELNGTIEIDSVAGVGTRISVRLPLTLAIIDGMSVAVGSEVYILPLSGIVESLQVAEGQVRSIAGQGLVIDVRSEYLPVLSLHELFVNGPALGKRASGTMVIVEFDGAKTALLVDELLGQHQVVVKSLEANYRKVHGISGATIMGDGRVALILDIATLTHERRQGTQARSTHLCTIYGR